MESAIQSKAATKSPTTFFIRPSSLDSLGNNSIRRFLSSIVLSGFVFFISLNTVISHATPSNQANGHANDNLTNFNLPSDALLKGKRTEEWARGRILVMPRAGLPAKAFAEILKEHDGKARKIGQSELYIVDLPEYSEEGAVMKLKHHPHLKFAELDRSVPSALVANDPYYASAWHLQKIGAHIAWDSSQGANITIAILDTGVDSTHPDLAVQMVPGWNFYDNNSNSSDVRGHGTSVAGVAAATTNNSRV